MKRALLKVLLLALPVLAVAGMLEVGLRHAPNYYQIKRRYFEACRPQVRILILGASQSNQGIRPDLLDPHAFNLAHVGQDYYYDLALLEEFLPKMPELRLVILPVAYISLDYRFPDTPEAWRTFAYSIHYHLPNEIPRNTWDVRNYSLLALTEPLQALQQAWDGFKAKDATMQADGFQDVEPLKEEVAEFIINDLTGRKRLRYHQSIMRPENRAVNLAHLERLAGQLQARGIRLLLVTLPVSKAYSDAVPLPAWLQTQRDVRVLAEKYHFQYWDYRDDPGFDLMDFADCDHLDREGAAKFSRLLKKDLDRAGLP